MKRWLTFFLVLAVAGACSDMSTAPAVDELPLSFARVNQVSVCHLEEETGLFELIRVSTNGKSLEKHLAHGDAQPGDEVPGMAGYEFDENCVAVAVEPFVFAIAYTDVDPNDGDGFKEGTDLLIAKVVDASGDGQPGSGDQIVFGTYPTSWASPELGRGTFSGGPFTGEATINNAMQLQFSDIAGTLFRFSDLPWVEEFSENPFGPHRINLSDLLTDPILGDLLEVNLTSTAQPFPAVYISVPPLSGGTDDAFLDVDINLPPV